jgi:hypothetical protein
MATGIGWAIMGTLIEERKYVEKKKHIFGACA